jgi:hypothetical protein
MFEGGTVYLVSANVQPNPGIVVFGVDKSMTETGGGFAVAISSGARATSNMGDLVPLDSAGVSESMDGYQTVYDCAG